MRSGAFFFTLVSIVMPSSSTFAQTTDPRSVFHRLERFYIEVGADQFEVAMGLYAPDAQILLAGQVPITGKINILNWWQATLKDYRLRVAPRLIEAVNVGEAVILQGEALGQLESRSGSASLKIDIWFIQIYRKQSNGEFLLWRGASGPNPSSPRSS